MSYLKIFKEDTKKKPCILKTVEFKHNQIGRRKFLCHNSLLIKRLLETGKGFVDFVWPAAKVSDSIS